LRGLFRGEVGGPHRQLAAFGHGVAALTARLDDHLLELRQIHLDRPQVAAVNHLELDLLADQPLQQVFDIDSDSPEVEHLRPQCLLARECQEMPHQRRGAVGVLA